MVNEMQRGNGIFMKIKIEKLSRNYGNDKTVVEALKESSFVIKEGEHLGITGASGSGKSTLLQLLGGLDIPTGGTVYYDDCDLFKMNDSRRSAFRRKNIGFVFQAYNLIPELNAEKNILVPLYLDKQKPDWEYFKRITETLNISNRLHHYPEELSGGQQQRVAIARAIINKPSVILCDEPTGNLDSKTGKQVLTLLTSVASSMQATLVVVTHEREFATEFKRHIIIEDGVLGGDLI